MKFSLIDRVIEIEPGKRIVAAKAVSLAEEYLAEHFPSFPVLPGVFMLESMVEAASWLVRRTEDFAHSVILLESAKGVTYRSFVAPGHLLRVEVDCVRMASDSSRFSGVGYCGDTQVVKGRFALSHRNLADRSADGAAVDRRIVASHRARWSLVHSVQGAGAPGAVSEPRR